MRKNAGYEIIKAEEYSKEEHLEIVLGKNERGQYVTWECRYTNNYFWPHYSGEENNALIDYHQRLAENYANRAPFI